MFPGSVKTSLLSAVLDRNAGKLINSAFIKPGSEGGGAWKKPFRCFTPGGNLHVFGFVEGFIT